LIVSHISIFFVVVLPQYVKLGHTKNCQ